MPTSLGHRRLDGGILRRAATVLRSARFVPKASGVAGTPWLFLAGCDGGWFGWRTVGRYLPFPAGLRLVARLVSVFHQGGLGGVCHLPFQRAWARIWFMLCGLAQDVGACHPLRNSAHQGVGADSFGLTRPSSVAQFTASC